MLQIRRGNRDNLGIIFSFFSIKTNVVCLIRTVLLDGSNEVSQYMFYYVYLYCTRDDLNKL